MTEDHLTAEGTDVLTLQDLIHARRDERGWSYADLEARSEHHVSKGRWQQLATGVRYKGFPEAQNIEPIANALEVDVTTVVLAAARSLGLNVSLRGPDLAQLLPAGTDLLTERMRDAILAIIRAAVAERMAATPAEFDEMPLPTPRGGGDTLEWDEDTPVGRGEPVVRRNSRRRTGDRRG